MKKIISLLMATIMLVSCINVSVYANSQELGEEAEIVKDIALSGSTVVAEDSTIAVDFNVTDQWDGAFNGSITIKNVSDDIIENWQIQFEFPHEIVDIWNAQIVSYENGIYNIKNSGGNNNVNIPVGGSVNFGFIANYEAEISKPENVKLISSFATTNSDNYNVEFIVLNDWCDGFTAQITITNNTNVDMENWHLEFDFGNEINNIWDAVIEKNENGRYYTSNAEYNSVIYANSSVTFGFIGLNSMVNEPENYILSVANNEFFADTPNEDIDYKLDSDEDGLPDWIEEYIGTKFDIADSDEDGLSDYYEFLYTYTDPTLYDTDDNGVCDAFEDTDGDGINNIDEIKYGTNPSNKFSDADELDDYEELFVYHTNPNLYDTDEDTLSDSDEVLLGLNPNKKDTDDDGILDCDEKIEQTIEQKIQCENLPAITDISVTMAVSGNINNSVNIENMYNINALSTDLVGIQGAPMDIICEKDFDSATITFTYNKEYININPEKLGILWYNEEEQFYQVMETVLDEENCKISMTTTHFSEYTVVDLDKWFSAWEEKIDYGYASVEAKNTNWNGKIVTAQQLCDEYNQFFDTDDGMSLDNVLGACEEGDIYALFGSIELSLNNGETIDYPCLFMSLEEIEGVKFVVDEYSTVFPIPTSGGWVSTYLYGYIDYDFPYYDEYGNIWPYYSDVTGYSGVLYSDEKFFVPSGQVDTTDDDEDGLYDIYELTGMRLANGQVIYTKTNTDAAEEEGETYGRDSDGDGLLDGQEVIRQNTEYGYFVLNSDPNMADTDLDTLCDNEDPEPLKPFDDRFMIVDSFEYIPDIEFVERHYNKGLECFSTKTSIEDKMKSTLLCDKYTTIAVLGDLTCFQALLTIKKTDAFLPVKAEQFSTFLLHYLNNNGQVYILSKDEMAEIIFMQNSNKEHYQYNINQLKLAVEEIITEKNIYDSQIFISTSGGNDFKVACYKGHNCFRHLSVYDDSVNTDWGYAIGEALGGMTSEAYMVNEKIVMNVKYYLIDTYEFYYHFLIPGEPVSHLEEELHYLHESGYAKEFPICGVYEETFIWEKGTIENDISIKLDNNYDLY